FRLNGRFPTMRVAACTFHLSFADHAASRGASILPRLSHGDSPETQAAVDDDHLPRDVGTTWPGQEDGYLANIVGLAKTTHGDHLLDEVAGLVADWSAHVGFNEARGDRVDRHAPAGQFDCQGPCEGVDRSLAGGVVRLPRVYMLRRDARDVDDAPSPLFHHRIISHRLAEVKYTAQVSLEHLVPLIRLHLNEQPVIDHA